MLESGKIYKLHEIPRHSWIRFEGELMLFNKLDGMYSICMYRGEVCYLSASADVEYVGEYEGFGNEDRERSCEGFEHIEGKEFK